MPVPLNAIVVQRRTGQEVIHDAGASTPFTLLDFWQWASSDLLGNALRGRFAEYIVACALGINQGNRVEWDAVDLRTPEGALLEVKSAAYLQSWLQKDYSAISFDIRPTLWWNAATATSSEVRARPADVYVFCLLHHKDKSTVDPLNLSQWTFYVLDAIVLDEKLPTQKRISLSTLKNLKPCTCSYEGLKAAINTQLAGVPISSVPVTTPNTAVQG
jgi:hypothetical protein